MSLIDNIYLCDGCGVEIVGAPVFFNKLFFCCQDCADGRECDCVNTLDNDEDSRSTSMGASVIGGELRAS